jgi:hypothetical protein
MLFGHFSHSLRITAHDFLGVSTIISLTVATLTACNIFTAVFEYKNRVIFNMTDDLVVILTLAFGIQTNIIILEYQKQVIFQYDAFGGKASVSDEEYPSRQYSANKDIPVRNLQSIRTCQ